MRSPSLIDTLITEIDNALRTLHPPTNRVPARQSPAKQIAELPLSPYQKKHSAGLMRVNHSGEVCAQALYQGQALTANLSHIKKQMAAAAAEEVDHLAWCEERLSELGSIPSVFNPVWYVGSLFLGAFAGLAGDTISLGFVAETERQVTAHLIKHLKKLPSEDKKTKAILELMQADEEHHAIVAEESGAIELPIIIKLLMKAVSKVMTKSSYYF